MDGHPRTGRRRAKRQQSLVGRSSAFRCCGIVAAGSTTVLIGGLPAARQGDVITEPGGPNSIATGATNVLIG